MVTKKKSVTTDKPVILYPGGDGSKWMVEVPEDVHRQLGQFKDNGNQLNVDLKLSVAHLNSCGLFRAAEWIKAHPRDYDYLYFYGSKPV